MDRFFLTFSFLFIWILTFSQPGGNIKWTPEGAGYYSLDDNQIFLTSIASQTREVLVPDSLLIPRGQSAPLRVRDFTFSDYGNRLLIFTNAQRVWRYETRGDYWVLDLTNHRLHQLGTSLPEASLMFAKFSPDGRQVAYVSERNIYVEHLDSHYFSKLTTTNGLPKLINGTFDWAYEEEFSCLDGFRWSPDGTKIAYWQIDANHIRDFYMINTTDSIYSYIIPVEYPKVGETPSGCRIGVVDVESGNTSWMKIPGDEKQNYIPRMDWAENSDEIIVQQLNRKQNESKLILANVSSGSTRVIFKESDEAWISVRTKWGNGNGWNWIDGGKSFLWITEKDSWRHLYRISRDGRSEILVTQGDFDLISPLLVNETDGHIYYLASPDDATEKYLYRSHLDGIGPAQRITPDMQEGTHSYEISPTGEYAYHSFSNYFTFPMREWISLPSHQALDEDHSILKNYDPSLKELSNIEFFTILTDDGVEMDAWMAKPTDFDPSFQYPVLFYVYTEPAGATVVNRFGVGRNGLYDGDLAEDGYIYISVDNRGTPAPKGREWRKSIYRKIGRLNIHDQAKACKKILASYPFIDPQRVAVYGWSGGGTATLNLLFQYPELYQTGIAVAAVTNQLSYDNIYQERYMGLPQENPEDFVEGSPIYYAKNLEGNLLYIHGTGDDNVHYQNAEMLINELIRHNKQFQVMPYPNRAHGIHEGEGTRRHLSTLFTNFLREHCPPGPSIREEKIIKK